MSRYGDDFYSMGEDAEMEGSIDAAYEPPPLPRSMWETREGERIRITDLGDAHLRNTIRFLRRRSDAIMLRYLINTSRARSNMGEYASDAFDYEAAQADTSDHSRCMFAHSKYRLLYAEAEKRWGEATEHMLTTTAESDK